MATITTNYDGAIIFTKYTDLLPWFHAKYGCGPFGNEPAGKLLTQREKHFARERQVQLMLLFRFERGDNSTKRTICKIRCPISPLPIKGEFEVVSLAQITTLLYGFGWTVDKRIDTKLLK